MLKRIKSFGVFVALSLAFLSSARAQFSSPSVAIISSAGIDAFAGTGIGSVLTRTTTGWKTLNCTSGQVMLFQGVGTNSICYTPTGTGTVTSVAATVPTFMSVSGSPVTSGGTLGFSYNSAAANTFLSSPSGSAGVPSFRGITATDIVGLSPTFNTTQNTVAAYIGNGNGAYYGFNLYYSSGWKYVQTDYGYGMRHVGNAFQFMYSPSGTSGTTATLNNYLVVSGDTGAITVPVSLSSPSITYTGMGAASLYGNTASSSGNAAPFTIQGLTDISMPSPAADWIPIYNSSSGTIKKVNASELQTAVGGGVSSYNSRTGAVVPASGDYSTGQLTTVFSGTPPSSGAIGELKTSTVNLGSAVSAVAATPTNITSLSLTAGSWVCSANPALYVQTGDTILTFAATIGTNSASLVTSPGAGYVQTFSGAPVGNSVQIATSTVFFDFASTTPIYLVGYYSLSGGATNSQLWGALNCYRRA